MWSDLFKKLTLAAVLKVDGGRGVGSKRIILVFHEREQVPKVNRLLGMERKRLRLAGGEEGQIKETPRFLA